MGSAGIMTGVFLQVRLDSNRLPRKALLPLGDKTVIEHAMASLKKLDVPFHVLLTDKDSASELQPYADKWEYRIYAGPKDDVLARFAGAAIRYGVQRIIRATGDNPLVSWHLAHDLLRRHQAEGPHFSGYLGPPLGTGVEIVETSALLEANDQATEPYEREHVNPFLYRRPGTYRIAYPTAPEECCFPGARVTLDTQEDYIYLRRLYNNLYNGEPIPTQVLVRWLKEEADAKGKIPQASLRVG